MWFVFLISSIRVSVFLNLFYPITLNCSLAREEVFGNGSVYDKCHHKTRETKNASG